MARKRLRDIKITTSTRFWFAIIAFFTNMIVFCFGIYSNIDPTTLGTGLALINAPLYGYIFGATVRPSREISNIKEIDQNSNRSL